ncbi:DNA N-6-adenine-methyltransferase (Dam) [Porphyromonadaceae bacterium KH3CP3RA]|nr:DNA N-6-adenine-methyltransferase (Dam) [Porphyromonadaceae bacterium KH3CP3RA]
MTIIETDEWYTPAEIIKSLGRFDLDPATSIDAMLLNRSARNFYTKVENGLLKKWEGRVWLNPPYSAPLLQEFLKKMAIHNKGIALVFAKIEAKWFHDIVLDNATAIKFLYDRVKFFRRDGTKGMQPRNASMLVAYGREDAEILSRNSIRGKFLYLNQ